MAVSKRSPSPGDGQGADDSDSRSTSNKSLSSSSQTFSQIASLSSEVTRPLGSTPHLSRILDVTTIFSDEEDDIQFVAGDTVDFEYSNRMESTSGDPSHPSKKKKKRKKKKTSMEPQIEISHTSQASVGGDPTTVEFFGRQDFALNNVKLSYPDNLVSVATAAAAAAAINHFKSETIKIMGANGIVPSVEDLANAITMETNKVLAEAAAKGGPNGEQVDPRELALRQQQIQQHIFQQMQQQLEQLQQQQLREQQLQQEQLMEQQMLPPLRPLQEDPSQQSPNGTSQQHVRYVQYSHPHPPAQQPPTPHKRTPCAQHQHQHQHQHSHDQQEKKNSFKEDRDKIWDTSSAEERQRIKQFWLSLNEEQRRDLVKIDKDTVMEKMREQKRTNCNCAVCGRKRTAIEELESLYEAYNDIRPTVELEEGTQSRKWEPFNFGTSLTIQGGILTVAEDLMKNDGKKFIDMMEHLAEKRMRREEEMEALAADYIWDGTEEEYEEDQLTDDEEDYEDEDEEYHESTDTEEDRWAESKRLLQMFAAKMFEQRVMAAYRERVANERQRKFLEELEEENRLQEEREAKKQRDKEKKKNKKRQQKQAKEEEKARREAEKAEAEALLKAKHAEKLEEVRQKKLEQKQKKDAERKQIEEERRRKTEEERLKELERKLEKQKREQQEREQQETAKKIAEEAAERERLEKEQKAIEEAERSKREAELSQQQAAKRKQRHQKLLLQSLQQHAPDVSVHNAVKNEPNPIPRPKADPAMLASLQLPSPRPFNSGILPSLPMPQQPAFQLQDSYSQQANGWPATPSTSLPLSPNVRAASIPPGISPVFSANVRSPPPSVDGVRQASASPAITTASLAPIQRPTSGPAEHKGKETEVVEQVTKQMGSSALLADDDEDDEVIGSVMSNSSGATNRASALFGSSNLFSDPFDSSSGSQGVSNGSWNPLLGSIRRGSMWSSSPSSVPPTGLVDNTSIALSPETIFLAAITAYQQHASSSADGYVPAHILYRSTVGALKCGEALNMQDFYMACGSNVSPQNGQFQLARDGFGLVTHIKYIQPLPQQQQQQQQAQYQHQLQLQQHQPQQQQHQNQNQNQRGLLYQPQQPLLFKNDSPPGMAMSESLNY